MRFGVSSSVVVLASTEVNLTFTHNKACIVGVYLYPVSVSFSEFHKLSMQFYLVTMKRNEIIQCKIHSLVPENKGTYY